MVKKKSSRRNPIYIVLLFIVLGTSYVITSSTMKTPYKNQEEGVICTQEAKSCPDGSYVGRAGSNCEFAPCPTVERFSDICTQDADCVATCPRDCLNKEVAKLGGRAACLLKPTHSCQCVTGHCKAY